MGSIKLILSISCGILVIGLSISVTADPLGDCFEDGQIRSGLKENSNCLRPIQACLDKSFPPVPRVRDTTLNNFIVSYHNVRRALVAGGGETRGVTGRQPGSNCMAKLEWDDELMNSAQNWANQCALRGAPIRNKITEQPVGGPYVGQNAYAFVDPATTIPDERTYIQKTYFKKAMDSWYAEISNFNSAQVTQFAVRPGTGHYSQMVWGTTTKIGCGWRRWRLDDNTGRFVWLVVCHYWPGGNLVGLPVYNTNQNIRQCRDCSPGTIETVLTDSTPDGKLCEVTNN